jgi:hypothetical protein
VRANNFKPLQTLQFAWAGMTLYSGLLALGVNILVAALVSALLPRAKAKVPWR